MNKQKLIISSAYGAIIAIIFVVVITIWAELSAPLKDWLKSVSGHHWMTKSIFSVLVYIIFTKIFYFLPIKNDELCLQKVLNWVFASVILGIIIITAFFTGHHFNIF